MPSQGERSNFLWRPNDFSSTTITRYDQEAEHWTRAFKRANAPKPTFMEGMNTLGIILQFIFAIIYVLVNILSYMFVWLFRSNDKKSYNSQPIHREQKINHTYANVDLPTKNKESRYSNYSVKKVESIIAKRPKVFQGKRSKTFKNAAKYVVMKQKISISNLMYELKIDFEKVSHLLDDLYEAGIISDPLKVNTINVLISDLEILKILFKMEKSYTI